MATISAASCVTFSSSLKFFSKNNQGFAKTTNLKMAPGGWGKNGYLSLRTVGFRVSCGAKPETVQKVCEIVRKQLVLSEDIELTPESKFSALGADSLDTVEIVMGLEEEFGINVEEESSDNITTVQEAADLIEKLIQKGSA